MKSLTAIAVGLFLTRLSFSQACTDIKFDPIKTDTVNCMPFLTFSINGSSQVYCSASSTGANTSIGTVSVSANGECGIGTPPDLFYVPTCFPTFAIGGTPGTLNGNITGENMYPFLGFGCLPWGSQTSASVSCPATCPDSCLFPRIARPVPSAKGIGRLRPLDDNPGDPCGTCGTVQCDGTCGDPCSGSGGDGGCDPNYGNACGTCGTIACDGTCQGDYDCVTGGGAECYSDSDCDAGCSCYDGSCSCSGTGGGGGSGCVGDYKCGYNQFCDTSVYPAACEDQMSDPLIIDLTGLGFPLTSAQSGVEFDFFNNGKPVRLAWTQPAANVGWLALDRNGDGAISDGAELFGNTTPQPSARPFAPTGFRALTQFDLPANGGNGDGVIDQKDAVFSQLRVWVDSNHNGVTDPGELLTMQQAGIKSISLHRDDAHWTDTYGNQFRYRSKIAFTTGKDKDNRYIYDVILAQSN